METFQVNGYYSSKSWVAEALRRLALRGVGCPVFGYHAWRAYADEVPRRMRGTEEAYHASMCGFSRLVSQSYIMHGCGADEVPLGWFR